MVDHYGTADALNLNALLEFQRNRERYTFLRWGQSAFDNFSVVPPDTGIVHQVNLEYLARVVFADESGLAYPDTVVGTDSHTTMINGVGVLGWGVGGIEAEAAMLGPAVDDAHSRGDRREAHRPARGRRDRDRPRADGDRDAAQARRGREVRRVLRRRPRAAAARGSRDHRQHGARVRRHLRHFPDRRRDARVPAAHRPSPRRRSRWCASMRRRRACGAYDGAPDAVYTDVLHLDLSTVQPSLAGPKRPQDRVALGDMQEAYREAFSRDQDKWKSAGPARVKDGAAGFELKDGAVVIAAITSCTNTSNPGGHDRRRPGGAERAPARPVRAALGQDLARAGLEGRHRVPAALGTDGRPRGARIQRRGLRLHDLHRQFRPAQCPDLEGDQRQQACRSPRYSRATAISRVACTRKCA